MVCGPDVSRGKESGRRRALLLLLSVLVQARGLNARTQPAGTRGACQSVGPVRRLPDLPEASGIAASRRMSDTLWAHNDSGEPVLFALDRQGVVKGRLRLAGATVVDWEDIAVGPCGDGSCIYVGDIGDNKLSRTSITVYRIPEPASINNDATVAAEAIHFTYPDGPHNAEALFVTGDARVFIVSKGESAPSAVYRSPAVLRRGESVRLERVNGPLAKGKAGNDDLITGADASLDGAWVSLRTHHRLTFFRGAEFAAGIWREVFGVDLRDLDEPQGEGVALGPDNAAYLVSEGHNESAAGTFATLQCTYGLAMTQTPLTPSVEDVVLEQDRMFQFVEPTMTLPPREVELLYRLNHEVEGEHGNTFARRENRMGLEIGLRDRLTGEIFANALQRETLSDPFTVTSVTAGLRYRLLKPRALWVDPAVLVEYQQGFAGHGSILEARLNVSKDVGRSVWLGNIGIESGRESGVGSVGDTLEKSFAFGVAYRILPRFSLGVETTGSYAGGTLGTAWGSALIALSAGASLERSVQSPTPPFRVGLTLKF